MNFDEYKARSFLTNLTFGDPKEILCFQCFKIKIIVESIFVGVIFMISLIVHWPGPSVVDNGLLTHRQGSGLNYIMDKNALCKSTGSLDTYHDI